MRIGRTRCFRRRELIHRRRPIRRPIAESPYRSTSRHHDCATPGHPTDAGPRPRTRPEKAAKHIRRVGASDVPTTIPPELPLPALDPPPLLPAAAGDGRAAAIATAPRHGRAGRIPVGRPLLRRGHYRQTGERERHGTGDEISLTSHNASEHVCRRTAEPTSTQQACQTRWSEYGLFSDSTPLAGCSRVLFRAQGVPQGEQGQAQRLKAQRLKASRLKALARS